MKDYLVRPFSKRDGIVCDVPSSKSALNRALFLAAFTEGDTLLVCGEFAEDTRAALGCIRALGIAAEEVPEGLLVHGRKEIPQREASLDVMSAGTAARFLTAILAFKGGDYEMRSSAQMENRPMGILPVLERAGVEIVYRKEQGKFPFRLHSEGVRARELSVDTDVSTQYASGLLLAAALGEAPFRLRLEGGRAEGSYIGSTIEALRAFGARCERTGRTVIVEPIRQAPARYETEPDLSGACYLYALSLLFGTEVTVRGVRSDTSQPDRKFLSLLEDRGVRFKDTPMGLHADGRGISSFCGFQTDMHDFSDQALTVAALAPFATGPTVLTGLSHTRKQECDRVHAIAHNLTLLGVPCEEFEDGVKITPAPPAAGKIATFGDHRVAMAFALIGLKTGTLVLDDTDCCKKTFGSYFSLLERFS